MRKFCFYHEIAHHLANDAAAWDSLSSTWQWDGVLIVDQLGDYMARNDPRAYASLADVITAHPSEKFIYLYLASAVPTGWTTTLLPAFVHPTDAIYVVGSNYTGIPDEELSTQNGSCIVSIAGPLASEPSLWSKDVGLIVAYDRFLKGELGL